MDIKRNARVQVYWGITVTTLFCRKPAIKVRFWANSGWWCVLVHIFVFAFHLSSIVHAVQPR